MLEFIYFLYPVHFIFFYTFQLFLFAFFFQLRAMKLSEEKVRNESEKKKFVYKWVMSMRNLEKRIRR